MLLNCVDAGRRVLSVDTVRNCLSAMYLSGMYHFSGEWAFSVGVPAKSGASGAIMIVIPGVMGIAVWSPPLDQYGNSMRGVAFSKTLFQRYNFHMFGKAISNELKRDLDQSITEVSVMTLGCAAGKGDLDTVLHLIEEKGVSVNSSDYNGRTPLHIACGFGQLSMVKYLLSVKADIAVKDGKGKTALIYAEEAKEHSIVQLLIEAGAERQQFRGTF